MTKSRTAHCALKMRSSQETPVLCADSEALKGEAGGLGRHVTVGVVLN